MDLAAGAKRLWVVMDHNTKDGAAKLVRKCTYPLTAPGAVKRVFTNYGVFDVTTDGFVVMELAPGVSRELVISKTDAPLIFKD